VRRGGFTLIEIMAVVTLLGLLAGATAWSLAEDARASSRAKVVADLAHADRMARLTAQCAGRPCGLRFDLKEQSFQRVAGPGEVPEPAHVTTLPKGFRIERMVTAAGDSADETPPGSAGSETTAWYSRAGGSGSYALLLAFEDGPSGKLSSESLAGSSVWLVFAGVTGQLTLVRNEAEVENLFAQLASRGPDAP
jgi:prepilin-type N-terminal cleavage/methylation domain-containing protein